jgi:uncharacterized protein (TIGR02118 family)
LIKLTFALHRLPHLSRSEFQSYWREQHGPLVKKHAAALRICRYTQVHTIDHASNSALQASRGAPEPFDGVAEIYWESLDDLAEVLASAEGRELGLLLLEDEKRFIDLSRSPLWLAEEQVVIESAESFAP